MFHNFESVFTWQTFSFNASYKKEEAKKNPNKTPKTLISFKEQQKSTKGQKPKNKPKGDQAKHLCG